MIDEKINPEISEESTDALGALDLQEEQTEGDDFKPENLPAEQQEQFQKIVQAVDDFIAAHPEYRQTEENQKAILDFLEEHDLPISPAALELAFEQLQDSLDLEPEAKTPEESESNRVRQAGSDALARKNEESASKSEGEPAEEDQEPVGKRGGKVIAFRNGRRVAIAG